MCYLIRTLQTSLGVPRLMKGRCWGGLLKCTSVSAGGSSTRVPGRMHRGRDYGDWKKNRSWLTSVFSSGKQETIWTPRVIETTERKEGSSELELQGCELTSPSATRGAVQWPWTFSKLRSFLTDRKHCGNNKIPNIHWVLIIGQSLSWFFIRISYLILSIPWGGS